MYLNFTRPLVRFFVEELRRLFAYHPKYPDVVDSIQGDYSFEERPQRGVVVKTTGGSERRLTWDNAGGYDESYIFQARVGNNPGQSLEWVAENTRAIQDNGGRFPSPPGVYFIDIVSQTIDPKDSLKRPCSPFEFTVTSVFDVLNEALDFGSGTVAFTQDPYIPGTLRLFEVPSGFPFVEGVDYTADPETGMVTLSQPLIPGVSVSADYRIQGTTSEPFPINEDRANYTAIPGATLAFGRRIFKGDRMAVVVRDIRDLVSQTFMGRWDFSLSFDVWGRDPDEGREMTDMILHFLSVVVRGQAAPRGIEVLSVSYGGETREDYNSLAQEFHYGSDISAEVQVDWMLRFPLVGRLDRVLGYRVADVSGLANATDQEVLVRQATIELERNLGLRSYRDPYFVQLGERFQVYY